MDFSIIKSSCIGATRNAWAKPERPCDYRKKGTSQVEDYVAKIFWIFGKYLKNATERDIILIQSKVANVLREYKGDQDADMD